MTKYKKEKKIQEDTVSREKAMVWEVKRDVAWKVKVK